MEGRGVTTQGDGVHPSEWALQPLGSLAYIRALAQAGMERERERERESGPPGRGMQFQRRVVARAGSRSPPSPCEVREMRARKQQPGNTTPGTQETTTRAPWGEGDGEGRPCHFRENAELIDASSAKPSDLGGKRRES